MVPEVRGRAAFAEVGTARMLGKLGHVPDCSEGSVGVVCVPARVQ